MIRSVSKCIAKDASHSKAPKMRRQIARSLVLTLTLLPWILAKAQNSNSTDQGRSLPTAPSPAPSMDFRSISSMPPSLRFEASLLPVALSQAPSQDTQSQPGQPADQKPVGTAAAPYEKPTGVAGSRPAGAAIAPGKQKRVHSIAIKVGVIAAAGVATGAVIGLSHASHSRPQ